MIVLEGGGGGVERWHNAVSECNGVWSFVGRFHCVTCGLLLNFCSACCCKIAAFVRGVGRCVCLSVVLCVVGAEPADRSIVITFFVF